METPPPVPPTPPLPTAPPPRIPKGTDILWSVLSHLSIVLGFLFVLIPLLMPLAVGFSVLGPLLAMKNESEFVVANAKEALNFHISVLLYSVCCIPLFFICIGIFLLWAIGIGSLILSIIAAIKASEGGCYRYPLTLRLVQ